MAQRHLGLESVLVGLLNLDERLPAETHFGLPWCFFETSRIALLLLFTEKTRAL